MEAYAGIGKTNFKYKDSADISLRPYLCPICSGWHMTHRSADDADIVRTRYRVGLKIQ